MNNQSLVSTCGTETRVAVTSSVLRFIKAARITTYYNVVQFYLVCASGYATIQNALWIQCRKSGELEAHRARCVSKDTHYHPIRGSHPSCHFCIIHDPIISSNVCPSVQAWVCFTSEAQLRKSRARGKGSRRLLRTVTVKSSRADV